MRRANEKGRVENGVGYVKKNFLAGLDIPPGLDALNAAARHWRDSVANARIHVNKIVALADIYGSETVARAIDDAALASAILDRLSHHCHSIVLEGDSYRTRKLEK